ncbi:MAG: hypothetical protein H6772_04920 [Pseudomonadales bacterium]|nr:hypothetical protein [Pseudomonadales bacterium]
MIEKKPYSILEARETLDPQKGKDALAKAMFQLISLHEGRIDNQSKQAYVEACIDAFANGVYFEKFWQCIGQAFSNGPKAFHEMDWQKALNPSPDTRPSEPDWNITDDRYDGNAREVLQVALSETKASFKNLKPGDEKEGNFFQSIFNLGNSAIGLFRGGMSKAEILSSLTDQDK